MVFFSSPGVFRELCLSPIICHECDFRCTVSFSEQIHLSCHSLIMLNRRNLVPNVHLLIDTPPSCESLKGAGPQNRSLLQSVRSQWRKTKRGKSQSIQTVTNILRLVTKRLHLTRYVGFFFIKTLLNDYKYNSDLLTRSLTQ